MLAPMKVMYCVDCLIVDKSIPAEPGLIDTCPNCGDWRMIPVDLIPLHGPGCQEVDGHCYCGLVEIEET